MLSQRPTLATTDFLLKFRFHSTIQEINKLVKELKLTCSLQVLATGGGAINLACCSFIKTNSIAITCLHLPPLDDPKGQEQLEPTIEPLAIQDGELLSINNTPHLIQIIYTLPCMVWILIHSLKRQ